MDTAADDKIVLGDHAVAVEQVVDIAVGFWVNKINKTHSVCGLVIVWLIFLIFFLQPSAPNVDEVDRIAAIVTVNPLSLPFFLVFFI